MSNDKACDPPNIGELTIDGAGPSDNATTPSDQLEGNESYLSDNESS